MTLYQTIESEMRDALRQKNTVKLSVLRMLLSAIKMLEIEGKIKAVQDADILQIIQKHVKQHRESIEQFRKGNRLDLVEKEELELKILESYLPKQLTEPEILDIIKSVIAETGLTNISDMGKVMKAAMEKMKGKADGKIVSQLVSSLLKA